MYEITMFVLTKMKLKSIIINNVTFVFCENGRGLVMWLKTFDFIIMLIKSLVKRTWFCCSVSIISRDMNKTMLKYEHIRQTFIYDFFVLKIIN
jgi:hypothetical protein